MIILFFAFFPIVAHDILFDRPQDPRVWYNAGVDAFMSNHYEQAAAFFEQARLRIADDDSMCHKALFNQGNAYAQGKEYEKALELFKLLEGKNPGDEIISKKRQYLEQLLQQPPESSSDKKQDPKSDSASDGEGQKSEKNNENDPESHERESDGARERKKEDRSSGQDGSQEEKDQRLNDRSNQNEHDRKDTESEKSTQEKEPQKGSDSAEKGSNEHENESANQKSPRQSELNQRIAAYLDAVDAQGQESFKADIQHACSRGGSHDKNW